MSNHEYIQEVIEFGRRLKTSYSSWDDFKDDLNKTIIDLKLEKTVRPYADKNGWRKRFSNNGIEGSKKSPIYWQDLMKALNSLKANVKNADGQKQKNGSVLKGTKIVVHNGFKPGSVKYSISKLQDTIIPYVYKSSYNMSFTKNVIFLLDYSWNKCLEKIITRDVDVAIHNFPTILAYFESIESNKDMFFFPFFTFSGYGICIKKEKIYEFGKKCGRKKISEFDDLSLKEKRDFLETNNIILERNTDLEWVYKKFCDKYQCNWSLIENNILDEDIDLGKIKFVNESSIGLYCTNSIHIADLKSNTNIEILEKITDHHNYNGLMCTLDFFSNNLEIIIGLISIWFNNISLFNNDLKYLNSNRDKKDFLNFHVVSLLEKLNEITNSKVSIEDFVNSYEKNEFFYSHMSASQSFISDVLNNDEIIINNLEIAELQLGKPQNEDLKISDKMRMLIEKLQQQIELVLKKI